MLPLYVAPLVLTASKLNFRIFSIWYNVKFYMVLTPKMIWEPLNYSSFLVEIYLWLNENFFKNSLQENMSILDQRYKPP